MEGAISSIRIWITMKKPMRGLISMCRNSSFGSLVQTAIVLQGMIGELWSLVRRIVVSPRSFAVWKVLR